MFLVGNTSLWTNMGNKARALGRGWGNLKRGGWKNTKLGEEVLSGQAFKSDWWTQISLLPLRPSLCKMGVMVPHRVIENYMR